MPRNVQLRFRVTTPRVNSIPNPIPAATGLLKATNARSVRAFHPVTSRFTSTPAPIWRQTVVLGILDTRNDTIISDIGGTGRRLRGMALYGEASTENSKVLYWLDTGFDRHRSMQFGYESLTRAGAGLRTFRKLGRAGRLYPFPIAHTEGRGFTEDAARKIAPAFIAAAIRILGRDAVISFFGSVRTD